MKGSVKLYETAVAWWVRDDGSIARLLGSNPDWWWFTFAQVDFGFVLRELLTKSTCSVDILCRYLECSIHEHLRYLKPDCIKGWRLSLSMLVLILGLLYVGSKPSQRVALKCYVGTLYSGNLHLRNICRYIQPGWRYWNLNLTAEIMSVIWCWYWDNEGE